MSKEVKITPPEGYEIDKENSTLDCIKFKLVKSGIKTYKDFSEVSGIDSDGSSWAYHREDDLGNILLFIDVKHYKSALAMAKISQLMPYYGAAITDKEWGCSIPCPKYTIEGLLKRKYILETRYNTYFFLAFHTKEQRDEFLSYPENVQLVKDYLMID